MTIFKTQWQQMQVAWSQQRLPQALLLVGPFQDPLQEFARALAALLVCRKADEKACGHCKDCIMMQQAEHPDLQWVRPEKPGASIKIEQIRELQQTAFLTPQRASVRVIVIEDAHRMNIASANALLKVLEEPPAHTHFILLAEQLSTMLPTILSRCQRMTFPAGDMTHPTNFLMLADHYPAHSEQAKLAVVSEQILDDLLAVIEQRLHVCVFSAKWAEFELKNTLWFFYLVLAQVQQMHFIPGVVTGRGASQLVSLNALLSPLLLCKQIDKLNALLKKLNKHIPLNNALAIEDFLLGLVNPP